MTFSADGFVASIFCLIFAPVKGYDEPEILLSQLAQFCLIGADAGQAEWAYYHAVKHDGGQPEDGCTMASMLSVIRSSGQPVELEWPYITSIPIDIATWLPPKPIELFFREHEVCGVSFQHLVDQLDAGVPILITMTLSDAFYFLDADGIVDRNEPLDPNRCHAVVATGHGEHAGKRFILIRNSWGEGWGLNGYAWLAEEYLAPRLLAASILTTEI